MKKNKIISILLAVVLVITFVPVSGMVASAETDTGTCGENLTWTIEDGTLTISGTGDMNSYADGKLPEYFVSGTEGVLPILGNLPTEQPTE